jgi:hypothetical protein
VPTPVAYSSCMFRLHPEGQKGGILLRSTQKGDATLASSAYSHCDPGMWKHVTHAGSVWVCVEGPGR